MREQKNVEPEKRDLDLFPLRYLNGLDGWGVGRVGRGGSKYTMAKKMSLRKKERGLCVYYLISLWPSVYPSLTKK